MQGLQVVNFDSGFVGSTVLAFGNIVAESPFLGSLRSRGEQVARGASHCSKAGSRHMRTRSLILSAVMSCTFNVFSFLFVAPSPSRPPTPKSAIVRHSPSTPPSSFPKGPTSIHFPRVLSLVHEGTRVPLTLMAGETDVVTTSRFIQTRPRQPSISLSAIVHINGTTEPHSSQGNRKACGSCVLARFWR